MQDDRVVALQTPRRGGNSEPAFAGDGFPPRSLIQAHEKGEKAMANEIYGEWKCKNCGEIYVATSHDYVPPKCPKCGTQYRIEAVNVYPSKS